MNDAHSIQQPDSALSSADRLTIAELVIDDLALGESELRARVADLEGELSQARRERDLAIELLVIANRHIGYIEGNRQRQFEFDRAMVLIDLDYERRKTFKDAA